ncbi:DNA polymerase phi-domain-containing protein [Radiomyces spectabilis]|uniref:DNA polymerase phi-domain-containing protein n=1 Tax=Radiomyces spectabilis TaxID=64574 RepID=UPI00221E3C6A|nr:DNA polymerase phi-domain-containing protein [Radiomyces spectabilis]KAI8381420.1 DNA polymerase phi-domain-containing protein [Radiomyces spectabilis]
MATTTLQLYWDLASFDPKVRLAAAQSLIQSLTEFQKAHEESLENTNEVASTEESLDKLCASDVSYAVRRLLRGLPSSRQGARQGFSLALTELLTVVDCISTKLVLDLLLQYTDRVGSMSGEEFRDMLFGRLFGLMSVVAAGMIARPTTTSEDTVRILENLAEMAEVKSYLQEVCYHVVINMLPSVKSASYKAEVADKIRELFLKGPIVTVDQLNLVLALQQHMPEIDLTEQFAGWKNQNVLHPANLPRLSIILKEIPMDDQETAAHTEWKPQLHSVWDRLLAFYLEKPTQIASFDEFWNAAVDHAMFEHNATHGRKFWGFQLVEKVLPRLSSDQMPLIFTENFMRSFINNLSSDVRYLNKAAKHTATVIQKVAESNKQVGFALLTQLTGKHGNHNFDQITKTKLVENIMATLNTEGITNYLEYVAETFVQQNKETTSHDDSKRLDSRREWALSQLALMVTNPKVPKEEDWILSVVRFLAVYAFFDVKSTKDTSSFLKAARAPSPALSETTRKHCRDRFQTVVVALSKLQPMNTAKESGAVVKSRRLHGVTKDGELWIYRVYDMIQLLKKDKEHYKRLVKPTEEFIEASKKSVKAVSAQSKEAAFDCVERGFEILFLNVLLHGLIDESESESLLEELLDCYEKMYPKKKASDKKKSKKTTEEQDEPQPIEVIVDMLVSFLTNASPVLKNSAEQVFENFSSQMTEQSLQVLLNVKLFGEDEEDEEDEDDEEDDDVEMLDMDDVEIEEEDDDEEEVDEEFRRKIEEAMKQQGVLAGDDDEDEELDDEAMEAFDEKLAEVFRQKKLEKSEKKNMQYSMVHFKNNVMDLISIFIRKNPTSPLVVSLIVPLLNVIRSTSTKSVSSQLVEKVVAFLKNRLSKANEYPKDAGDSALETLKAVLDFAKHSSTKQQTEMCASLSLYLRKCIIGGTDVEIDDKMSAATKERLNKMMAIYNDSLKTYMMKKTTHFSPSIIASLVQRFPLSSWPLLDTLVVYININEPVNQYRHTTACQWAGNMIQRVSNKKSDVYDKRLLDVMPEIAKQIKATLTTSLEDGQSKSLNYDSMRHFLKFVGLVMRTHRKVVQDDVSKVK